MINVLLAGFGGLGDQDHQTAMYLPAFTAHPAFRIAGVAATHPADEPRALAAAESAGVPYHADLATALSTVDAPVVSVAAPAQTRTDALLTAVRAGRHVLADKPFTPTRAEAEQVVAAAEGTGIVVAQHHRYHPMVTAGVAALRGGTVGLPWNVQVDFVVAGGHPCQDELLNFGGYPVDVVAALTNLPVLRVHATAAGPLTVLALGHEHGMTSTIVVGRTAPRAGVPEGRLAHHRYRVSGSHGVLVLDATKPAVTVSTASGLDRQWLPVDTLTGLLDDLHAVVTGAKPAGPTLDDALRTAAVLDAARRSLTEGVPVATDGGTA
ncbi:Gfo/Idh/MocA family protein [Actinophytocola algeriensis]|uniref:Putative dehydrogenase n=1 Tax=Actinophytocola algeriensis TaxID=1768010 RepID=A0A7W7QAP8_9PSEU|nr:Gfo/Idh/MocA family oxidoreductase [Actinophytocola algeriensis]MBB4909968.1 putative dehydrogenase [Actinophytocola algeriensis]MBE1475958.1 putative dehydrogenase [Actinophytocola algeriensis]